VTKVKYNSLNSHNRIIHLKFSSNFLNQLKSKSETKIKPKSHPKIITRDTAESKTFDRSTIRSQNVMGIFKSSQEIGGTPHSDDDLMISSSPTSPPNRKRKHISVMTPPHHGQSPTFLTPPSYKSTSPYDSRTSSGRRDLVFNEHLGIVDHNLDDVISVNVTEMVFNFYLNSLILFCLCYFVCVFFFFFRISFSLFTFSFSFRLFFISFFFFLFLISHFLI
jgi:hypothetical protein